MKSTLMQQTPATGLPSYVPAFIAPNAAAHGTGLPFAGTSAAAAVEAAVAGVRNTDLPGSPPRGAPV